MFLPHPSQFPTKLLLIVVHARTRSKMFGLPRPCEESSEFQYLTTPSGLQGEPFESRKAHTQFICGVPCISPYDVLIGLFNQ